MNNRRHSLPLLPVAIGCVAASLVLAQMPGAQSATLTWLGTLGTSWSTTTGGTSNWSGNAVPANGDTLVFTGGSNLNTSNDLSGLTLSGTAAGSGGYSLNINSSSTINIGGSQLLTIGAGSSGEIQLVGTGTHTISAPMFLKDAGFFIRFNGVKTISGVMSGTAGAGGPDEVALRGDSDTDRLILSGNNTYQVFTKTLIDRGVIQANSLGNANESGSLGKGSEIWGGVLNWNATIDYVGAGNSTDRKLMIGRYATDTGGMGVLSNGSGALVFTSSTLNSYLNATDITANRTLTLGGTNSADNTIQSVITNNRATGGGSGFSDTQGTISIAKNDAGRWILSGNNSYTGTTTISAGLLIAGHANALGSTYAGTTVSSGASLGLQGGITTAAEALSITGTGMSNAGALRNLSGANTYAGTVTLAGNSTVGADAGTLTVSGPITGTSQVLTVVGSGTVTLSNAANTFGSGLTGNNVGLFIRGGNVRNGVANAVNSNVMATVESGTWDLAGYNQSVRTTFSKGLGLGGAAGTAVVNTGTGVLTLLADSTSQQSRIDYLSAGNGQGGVISGQLQYSNSNNLMYFYVEDSSNAAEDLTINATISKAGSPNTGVFFKGGAGSMLLNGTNSFNAAALRVDSGSMILGANDPANGSAGSLGTGISSITVGYNDPNVFNASLLLRSGVTSSRSIATLNNTNSGHSTDTRTLGGYDSTGTATFSGAVELNNAATDGGTTRLQALGTSTVTFSGNISDNPGDTAVGINKIGGGTVVLSGSNSYRGATTVTAGRLTVNGLLGNGNVSVAAGSILAGSGTIGGAVSMNGTLSPGNSPGVLTLASLVLSSSATTLMEINGQTRGGQYDGINLTTSGGLTYGGLLSLSFGLGSAVADQTTFDLFNFSGTPLGDFAGVTSTGAVYAGTWLQVGSGTWSLVSGSQTLTFRAATGDIIVVPEPGALALAAAGIGLAAAAWTRRRSTL